MAEKRKGRPSNLRGAFTPEEARDFGRRGGLASAAKKREQKRLKELAQALLQAPSQDDPSRTRLLRPRASYPSNADASVGSTP